MSDNRGIADHVGAITRVVVSRMHEGRPANVITATRTFDTTIDDVWEAITNAERIPRWFLPVSGNLQLGGRYQLEGNAGGEITRCAPPRQLSLTWEFGGQVSWVNVRLKSSGAGAAGKTELELEHIAPADDQWKQFGPGAVGIGWDLGLYSLAKHLSTGAAVAGAEGVAWMASDEGRAFMRGSSESWGRAAIAGGTGVAEARAAADRTTAAFLGEGNDAASEGG